MKTVNNTKNRKKRGTGGKNKEERHTATQSTSGVNAQREKTRKKKAQTTLWHRVG